MRVSSCGYNYRHDAGYVTERPNGIEEYVLLIIRSPARITIDGIDHFVDGNSIILYQKGTPQYFAAHNADFVNDWVQFSLDDEDLAFCKRIGIPFDSVLPVANINKLSRLVAMLFEERWTTDYQNTEESKTLLLRLLLLKLADLIPKAEQAISPLHIRLKILKYDIYTHPELDWSIDTISKNMSISSSYLYTTYRQLFGTSIKEDVTASRLEKAKQLLISTNYNITTISNMVGYNNDVHFMYMFKKKTGFTPSQYRRSFDTYFSYLRYNSEWAKSHPPSGAAANAPK